MDELLNIAADFWRVLAAMSPYLLFGFLVAGLLSVFISPGLIESHLGGTGLGPVLKAALFGIPLPLCSCGVIPVSAGLRRHGASRGATTAFLLSTPQTGVDSIFVTFSLLGPVFAVFRPVVALVSGLVGGSLVSFLDGNGKAGDSSTTQCTDECCVPGSSGGGGRLRRVFRFGFVTLPRDIGKALLVGIVIAGVISALLPEDFFASLIRPGLLQILVLMLLGIPVYVCATASVPVAAALVVTGGVSPGAALAFLMTGPATNAAAVATIWKIMGKRTALIYLVAVAVTAFAAGLLLDASFPELGETIKAWRHAHHEASTWWLAVQWTSAVALLGVLAVAICRPTLGRLGGPVPTELARQSVTLKVEGMTCSHCVGAVTHAIEAQPGVLSADVELKTGRAVVYGTQFDPDAVRRAVNELGYKATRQHTEQVTEREEECSG